MDEIQTESEVAERLKVPPATLRQWRYLNRGPEYVKVGRHVRYLSRDVSAWLEEQRGDRRVS